jgi:hypothetical protein
MGTKRLEEEEPILLSTFSPRRFQRTKRKMNQWRNPTRREDFYAHLTIFIAGNHLTNKKTEGII